MALGDQMMGVIYGVAIGDAMGYPVEFLPNPQGVVDLPTPALYSDDTQMFRATLEGLLAAGRGATLEEAAVHVGKAYVAWSVSPENNRAPGGACMYGCAQLARGMPWRQSGKPNGGGCGAAMRSMAYVMWHRNNPPEAARWAAWALMSHAPDARSGLPLPPWAAGTVKNDSAPAKNVVWKIRNRRVLNS